jgi:hypothetical protein
VIQPQNPVTHHKDYFGRSFAKLKHSDASSPILLGAVNPILTRTQTSQVLDCTQKPFSHRIRNSGSPAPKYSELPASHRGSLRSKGYLYPYPIRVTLDSRVLRSWSRSVKCTPTFHPHTIHMSPHALVKRTTN